MMSGNVFLYFRCFLYYQLIFWMRLSDSVWFSVYMNIIFRYVFACLENCPRSVNNVRTILFFVIVGGDLWGPKWSPPSHPHPQRQCQSSLPGEQMWKQMFDYFFLRFLWKRWQNDTKMITLCSIRRVGPKSVDPNIWTNVKI